MLKSANQGSLFVLALLRVSIGTLAVGAQCLAGMVLQVFELNGYFLIYQQEKSPDSNDESGLSISQHYNERKTVDEWLLRPAERCGQKVHSQRLMPPNTLCESLDCPANSRQCLLAPPCRFPVRSHDRPLAGLCWRFVRLEKPSLPQREWFG